MEEYKSVFIKSLINSILPEFMDSDRFDDESLSPEFKGTIRKIADHYYKSDAVTEQRKKQYKSEPDIVEGLSNGQINYSMVNKFLGLDSYFQNPEYQGKGTDIKMILGTFKVNRTDDGGYRVTDIYDFSNNNNYFRKVLPSVADLFDDMGINYDNNMFEVMAGGAGSIKYGAYPLARSLAEIFMPDTKPPEEGGATLVDFTIPPEDEVVDIPLPIQRPDEVMLTAEAYRFPTDPMDSDRKNFLDKMLNFIFPEAEAGTINDNVKPLNDLQLFNKLKKGGYEPFPMDGNDEYGRMNDAQRAIVDMGESILESDMND
tara:strand:- start:271 stop:1215 length:945 start_codon:yes stop_codon:yes gene_type:complete